MENGLNQYLDQQFGEIRVKIDAVDTKVNNLDSRVRSLDERVTSLGTKVDALDTKIDAVEVSLKQYVHDSFGAQQTYIDERFNELTDRSQIKEHLARHDSWIHIVADHAGVKLNRS